MRIAMVSDSESHGGAAVAASRLASALTDRGYEVIRIVSEPDGRSHGWKTIHLKMPLTHRILRRLLPRQVWQPLRETGATTEMVRLVNSIRPDVVNFHNIHGVFSSMWRPSLVRSCADLFPAVWTLHDMWSFTGRCAYNDGCRKFEIGCDASCPSPHQYPVLEPRLIRSSWEERSVCIRTPPGLTAVAPSRWLAEEAMTGLWPDGSVEVIPYGLPLDIYTAGDREAARNALGIESSGLVLLTVAVDWVDDRKGGRLLCEALSRQKANLTLVTMGVDHRGWSDAGSVQVHRLGYLDNDREKVLAFNAADALIHPAIQDNLPNVVLEAIACGTPVIGFQTGGVPEMVRPGATGWLAEKLEAGSLAEAIGRAGSDLRAGIDLRPSCRDVAERDYDLGLQARRYESLFLELVQAHA